MSMRTRARRVHLPPLHSFLFVSHPPPTNTYSPTLQLKDTLEYQRKSRRCYCCCIIVLVVVILAVTIGVGAFFGVKQNSGRLLRSM